MSHPTQRRRYLRGQIAGAWGDTALRVVDPGGPDDYLATLPDAPGQLVRGRGEAVIEPQPWDQLAQAIRAERAVPAFRIEVADWSNTPLPDAPPDVSGTQDGRAGA